MWGYRNDISEDDHKSLPDSESADVLTSDFPVSKAVGHKAALTISQPVQGIFVLTLEGSIQHNGFDVFHTDVIMFCS